MGIFPILSQPQDEAARRGRVARYGVLLGTMFGVLILSPLVSGKGGGLVLGLLFLANLFAALLAVSENRSILVLGILLIATRLADPAWNLAPTGGTLELLSYLGSLTFLILVAVIILLDVLRQERVDPRIVFGGVCVYMLLGLVFAELYGLLEYLEPGSFAVASGLGEPVELTHWALYFSYVTLTTLGYGDVTPLTHAARTYAVVEALMGQLYLTILVARLVGLVRIGRRGDED